MLKVVREKLTRKTVYRQQPNFEEGLGIKNAISSHPEYKPRDLEEVEITQAEWDGELELEAQEILKEQKIKVEMDGILREQAITNLKARGEI